MGIEIGRTSLALDDRIEFFRSLASWLQSGGGSMPVHEALKNTCDSFSRDEYRTLKSKFDKIYNEFHSGQTTITAGLRSSNLGFMHQELAILDAAEKANQLRLAVPALVEALEMRAKATKSLKGKLTMPLVGGFMLILMSIGVLVFMMPTVMEPVLSRDASKVDSFPSIIRYYWYLSVWIRSNPWIVTGFFSAPILFFLLRKVSFVKPHYEKMMMGFGPARKIIISFNSVLVVYFMPALVRAGMPLPEVLKAIAELLDNSKIKGIFSRAAIDHEQGYRLGEVLEGVPFKGAFRSAVEAGEKTGMIAERVEDLKTPFLNDYERIVKKSVSALMMIVMGLLMPMFLMSMYTTLVTPMIALMEYS
ncbi:MAG: type II secretion system F family protein [Pseudomonadota bacterium]|nr:type II secretion system F family protein [Pseudomonadota bacterium]